MLFFTKAGYLSMLCYNFGVDCFQKHIYEHSVNWLRESFEIGKMKNAVGNKNQVRLNIFKMICSLL